MIMFSRNLKPIGNSVLLTVLAVVMIAGYRLMPHPWNFTPVTAAAIFGGMILSGRRAWIVPLLSMFLSDIWLGISWPDMPFVYGSILIAVGIGVWVRKDRTGGLLYAGKILGGTVLSSVLFFLITNFGSWLILPMYPKTISGLSMSYMNAVPFFQHSLAGDVCYIILFAAAYEAVSILTFKRRVHISGKD